MGEPRLPPVEIVSLSDEPAADETAETPSGGPVVHAAVRTASALVAALALVWMAWSVAAIRANDDTDACRSRVDTLRYALEELAYRDGTPVGRDGRPEIEAAAARGFVEEARSCGLDSYADLLEQMYLRPAETDD